MILDKLRQKQLITPPSFIYTNTAYLTIMGSNAYGVSSDNSDLDVYGFCIPPKDNVFPHLSGQIVGFGKQIVPFEQWQHHHIREPDSQIEYDFSIYNIVKYFQLCMECNPNMIDSLFTPRNCVIHSTQVGEHVRDNRRLFLSKAAWAKFKGYSYSQYSKIRNKVNATNEKRAESIEKFGYDLKYAYHLVRLLNEVEQILVEGDLDLQRNREQLKAIRRGEWTLDEVDTYFKNKESVIETTYANSTLRAVPEEDALRKLLVECLEMHFGDLSKAVNKDVNVASLLNELSMVMDKFR